MNEMMAMLLALTAGYCPVTMPQAARKADNHSSPRKLKAERRCWSGDGVEAPETRQRRRARACGKKAG